MSYNLVCTKVEDLDSNENIFLLIDHHCLDNIVDNYFYKKYEIAKSHGYKKEIMDDDFELVKNTTSSLIKELTDILNKHHNINFSNKQWQILISFWLHRTISLLLNRFNKLEKTLSENIISSITLYKNQIIDLVNLKTIDISIKSRDLYWNNIIYDEIIKFKNINIKINYISKKLNYKNKFKKPDNFLISNSSLWFKKFSNFINKKRIENSKSLIFESCLPKIENKKLLKYYNQPNIYFTNRFEPGQNIDLHLRKNLENELVSSNDYGFNKFVKKIIFKLFPSCYLENFNDLNKVCDKSILPKKPKFIFSSNSFDTNEIFKLYLCKNLSNTKYYAGQHGGATPIYRFGVIDAYLFSHVNGFFNWGWKDEENNYKSFLFPKLTKKNKYKNNRKIALMLRPMMHTTEIWDRYEESLLMFKKNVEFIKKSKNFNFYDQIVLKAYPRVFCEINNVANWKNHADISEFDNNETSFDNYKNECAINIFTYESTGFFQLININKPTMILFSSFDKDIKEDYKNDFNELAKVGIVHFDNNSLLKHLNDINKNIDDWWYSNLVQNKVINFKKKFASDKYDYKLLTKNIKY